mmetsp:Transcript_105891/g.210483  ORF Transcript_105891/g.210483 Transcript_105891/m.210483 type:complete len:229 (+) Transcript_105891:765-1451(+)
MLLLAISAGMLCSSANSMALNAQAALSNFAKPPPILGFGLKVTKPGKVEKKVRRLSSSMPFSDAPTEATVSTSDGSSCTRGRLAAGAPAGNVPNAGPFWPLYTGGYAGGGGCVSGYSIQVEGLSLFMLLLARTTRSGSPGFNRSKTCPWSAEMALNALLGVSKRTNKVFPFLRSTLEFTNPGRNRQRLSSSRGVASDGMPPTKTVLTSSSTAAPSMAWNGGAKSKTYI